MKHNVNNLSVDNIYKGAKVFSLDVLAMHPDDENAPEGFIQIYSPFHEFEVTDFEVSTITTGPLQSKLLVWFEVSDGAGDELRFNTAQVGGFVILHVEEADKPKPLDPIASAVADSLHRQATNSKTRA